MSKIATAWNNFFFAPTSLYNVGLFRCLFGVTILVMYAIRFVGFKDFYFNLGMVPAEKALEILPPGYATNFAFFLPTDAGIYAQGILHLVLIVGFALGLYGRSLTWLLFLVNLGLMQRNMSVVYGADLFTNLWLFYLSFVNHNRYFSLWNVICKKRVEKQIAKQLAKVPAQTDKYLSSATDFFSPMGVRLIQIQLCLAYAYTGIEKLKGTQWWEGSAIWYVIGMEEMIPNDLAFLAHVPGLVAALSMLTVVFEIYFIFAVWNQRLRPWWLLVGVGFHLGTAVFMDLWFFCFVMITPYLLFKPGLCRRS